MFGLNQGSIYSIITIIFFSYYTRQKVYPILVKFYNDVNFFRLFTFIMSSQEMIEVFEENEKKPDDARAAIMGVPEKYEDKFLNDIRKLNKEFVFDEKEEELERTKFDEIFLLAQEEHKKKLIDIKDKIWSIEREIEIQKSGDDFFNVEYN